MVGKHHQRWSKRFRRPKFWSKCHYCPCMGPGSDMPYDRILLYFNPGCSQLITTHEHPNFHFAFLQWCLSVLIVRVLANCLVESPCHPSEIQSAQSPVFVLSCAEIRDTPTSIFRTIHTTHLRHVSRSTIDMPSISKEEHGEAASPVF